MDVVSLIFQLVVLTILINVSFRCSVLCSLFSLFQSKVPFFAACINHRHCLHHLFVRVRHFRQQLSIGEYRAIVLVLVLTILLSVFSSYFVWCAG